MLYTVCAAFIIRSTFEVKYSTAWREASTNTHEKHFSKNTHQNTHIAKLISMYKVANYGFYFIVDFE